ncbi:MAG: hypothetical protein KJ630_13015 [Proteobacteria bacterium]|nr:hypothetical protein [Pseudomonadota bacterium]
MNFGENKREGNKRTTMKTLMNGMARWLWGSFLLIPALLLVCVGTGAASEKKPFLDTIKSVDAPFDSRSVQQVQPVPQPTVVAKEEYQGGQFRVLARKEQIERHKCSNCHGEKEVKGKNAFTLTHGNVVVQHGREGSELACIDCHHPQDRDALEDKKGRKIDFDHSYQLCGQCHFRQKRDWLGGAHGKRVSYWAGERIIFNCTTCHDPHAPRFAKRFPATYSVPLN